MLADRAVQSWAYTSTLLYTDILEQDALLLTIVLSLWVTQTRSIPRSTHFPFCLLIIHASLPVPLSLARLLCTPCSGIWCGCPWLRHPKLCVTLRIARTLFPNQARFVDFAAFIPENFDRSKSSSTEHLRCVEQERFPSADVSKLLIFPKC